MEKKDSPDKILYEPYKTFEEQKEGEDRIKKEMDVVEYEDIKEVEELSIKNENEMRKVKQKFKLYEITVREQND